jgi:hypothetical protein
MHGNFKFFGILPLVALVFGILEAPAAEAGEFKAGANPARITGQQVGQHALTTKLGSALECDVAFEGQLAGSSEDLTLTPSFSKCEIGAQKVDVAVNGCDYLFHAGATLAGGAVEGSMDIKCPPSVGIEFGITSGGATCFLRIGEQVGLNDVTYTNHPMAKDVDFDSALEGISYELGPTCAVQGVYEDGTYEGVSTVKAESGGVGVGFSVE